MFERLMVADVGAAAQAPRLTAVDTANSADAPAGRGNLSSRPAVTASTLRWMGTSWLRAVAAVGSTVAVLAFGAVPAAGATAARADSRSGRSRPA